MERDKKIQIAMRTKNGSQLDISELQSVAVTSNLLGLLLRPYSSGASTIGS